MVSPSSGGSVLSGRRQESTADSRAVFPAVLRRTAAKADEDQGQKTGQVQSHENKAVFKLNLLSPVGFHLDEFVCEGVDQNKLWNGSFVMSLGPKQQSLVFMLLLVQLDFL